MIKELFSFQGRLRRTRYVINYLLAIVAFSLMGGLLYLSSLIFGESDALFHIYLVILTIPLFWFLLAQRIKRIHDIGESGWLILVCMVPYINIFFEFYMLLAKGTKGVNKYGENPRLKNVIKPNEIK